MSEHTTEMIEVAADVLALDHALEALKIELTAKKVRLAELAGAKEEGSQTVEVGEFKITTRRSVNRKIIEENLGEALSSIDSRWLDVVRVKHSVDKKRLDQMEREDRASWLKMSRAIEVSNQAVGVLVRRIEVTA